MSFLRLNPDPFHKPPMPSGPYSRYNFEVSLGLSQEVTLSLRSRAAHSLPESG